MAFPKATVSRKPSYNGEFCMVGGSCLVTTPVIMREGNNPERPQKIASGVPQVTIEVGDDMETAQMICDAINEKLERDFCHGST